MWICISFIVGTTTLLLETMEALHDVVKAGRGKIYRRFLYVCVAVSKSTPCCGKSRLDPFCIDANHCNLMYREEEREMLPLCKEEKIALTPYSPLASGRLVRDWSVTTNRTETDKIAVTKYGATIDVDRPIYDRGRAG